MKRILVIDDEQAICMSVMFALEDEYDVTTVTDAAAGLEKVTSFQPDVVLLDMRIKDTDGLSLIQPILSECPKAIIIVMTAYGTIETSVKAIKMGAFHYVSKPLNIEELKMLIEKGIEYHSLHTEVHRLQEIVQPKESYAGLVGKSPVMKQLFSLLERIKNISSNVLIIGESGTGKELVARALHFEGERKQYPFSVLNCAAIPESLLESELFGYEKGAFTGATSQKEGVFERTDKGTLFLDEIGEMPIHLQAKLLRVIQEREVTPIGSGKTRKIDVRIIAATNRDLMEEVKEGRFREDLYYRLNVIPVELAPLRNRMEDIPLLISHFLSLYSEKLNRLPLSLSHDAKEWLYFYDYPGNIRELSNITEYAAALAAGEVITINDLPLYLRKEKRGSGLGAASSSCDERGQLILEPGMTLAEAEKLIILHTLKQNDEHRKHTAEVLGISERTLRDKLKLYKETSVER